MSQPATVASISSSGSCPLAMHWSNSFSGNPASMARIMMPISSCCSSGSITSVPHVDESPILNLHCAELPEPRCVSVTQVAGVKFTEDVRYFVARLVLADVHAHLSTIMKGSLNRVTVADALARQSYSVAPALCRNPG